MASLTGKRVAFLVEDDFEDRELTGPLEALQSAGATVVVVGPVAGADYRGKRTARSSRPRRRRARSGSRTSTPS